VEFIYFGISYDNPCSLLSLSLLPAPRSPLQAHVLASSADDCSLLILDVRLNHGHQLMYNPIRSCSHPEHQQMVNNPPVQILEGTPKDIVFKCSHFTRTNFPARENFKLAVTSSTPLAIRLATTLAASIRTGTTGSAGSSTITYQLQPDVGTMA
jgi:hypothetical protein